MLHIHNWQIKSRHEVKICSYNLGKKGKLLTLMRRRHEMPPIGRLHRLGKYALELFEVIVKSSCVSFDQFFTSPAVIGWRNSKYKKVLFSIDHNNTGNNNK